MHSSSTVAFIDVFTWSTTFFQKAVGYFWSNGLV